MAANLPWKSGILAGILTLFLSYALHGQHQLENALRIIQENPTQYGVSQKDFGDWQVYDNYVSRHNGLNHIYIQQTVGGIPVEGAVLNINMKANGEVFSHHSRFVPDAHNKTNGTASVTASAATLTALAEVGIPTDELREESPAVGPTQKTTFDGEGIAEKDIISELLLISEGKAGLRLVWEVKIDVMGGKGSIWAVKVDAASGEYLSKRDLVLHCNFGGSGTCSHPDHQHGTVEASQKVDKWTALPKAQENILFAPDAYRAYPIGVESPNHGSRSLLVDPANLNASPYGWHDTNGANGAEYTITRGNNVHAQEDQNGNNGTGFSPDGGSNLEFDFTQDFSQNPETDSPAQNRSSAITNLFVWNNFMHDVWYEYGFDEASGNFQQNNYGNGGVGGDYVLADAQDGGGTNNANFSTPGDGGNGRMQMYLWTGGGADVAFNVNSPSGIAGGYGAAGGNFGATNYSDVTGNLVIVNDGSSAPTEACSPPFVNANEINNNIALIDRGDCQFGSKCLAAQDAGAIAVVICNNEPGGVIQMGAGVSGASVTIPCIMISQSDCATIRAQIPTVNATLSGITDNIALDGDLDNGIVAHEYGHGISIRLAGGPNNSGCLYSDEQAGEGWSDFFALVMSHKPGDDKNTIRGIGTYAAAEPINGDGIRTYPYTYDMSVNPFTYGDISGEFIPHGVGSVFCTMLWDLYWNLIDEHGYDPDIYNGTGGNNIAMQLVLDGIKLQPCGPGFVDMRDAILAADEAAYGGENKCIIWETFARRGLGYSAIQGSPNDTGDGIEAFDLPPGINGVGIVKTSDVEVGVEGDVITYTVTLNSLCADATNVIVVDDLPDNLTYVEGSATDGGTHDNGTITWPGIADFPRGSVATYSYQTTINEGSFEVGATIFSDDIENGPGNWDVSNSIGLSNWKIVNVAGNNRWFAEELETGSQIGENQYLVTGPIQLNGYSELSFRHKYDTEVNWDGGTVEISTNGGNDWTDLGPYMTANGYNDYIANNPSSPAFSGSSGNALITTRVDLGAFCGASVHIRFNFYYDAAVEGNGWLVDDVMITSSASAANIATATSDNSTSSDFACVRIADPVSDEEILESQVGIQLFPNPTRAGELNLNITGITRQQDLRVGFINQAGQLVDEQVFPVGYNNETLHLDTRRLAPGIYAVRVVGDGFSLVEKLVISQ